MNKKLVNQLYKKFSERTYGQQLFCDSLSPSIYDFLHGFIIFLSPSHPHSLFTRESFRPSIINSHCGFIHWLCPGFVTLLGMINDQRMKKIDPMDVFYFHSRISSMKIDCNFIHDSFSFIGTFFSSFYTSPEFPVGPSDPLEKISWLFG